MSQTMTKGPDLAAVDSLAKAVKLERRGELEKWYLMPLELGGHEVPENAVYVPIGLASVKERIDSDVIAPLAAAGKLSNYLAQPKYLGDSVIPISIEIIVSGQPSLRCEIGLWGAGLVGLD